MAEELVTAVRRMTEGALLEENSKGGCVSEEELYRVTSLKTGALFRWCALALSRLAKKPALFEPCARLGEETGVCFQIIDDALDFESEAASSGKDSLKDIFDGKRTLPLVLALKDKTAGPELEKLLSAFSASGSKDLASATLAAGIVIKKGFTEAAREMARARAQNNIFPLIDLLPEKECAADFKNYISELIERRA
jgi:octaprenyl-diphosphate synthase